MNSTGDRLAGRGVTPGPLTAWRWILAVSSAWLAFAPALAQDNPMPRPPPLKRDVQCWLRVYTQIDTNAGFLHDQYNLSVVYDTLSFAPNTTPSEREREVDQARERYGAALRRVAEAGEAPLSADDQRVRELWGPEGTPARLHSAIEDIRFQLGQADRFRAGLIRSGAWETHIAETLANLGLPAELAVLPHVESSFNPAAYSKVGAAGLWQFMRSTGRRYMRIDGAVDDRLDPFRSTEAAAQLLAFNYRVLGSWPLALTAYNHGTAGVRRAKETLGTGEMFPGQSSPPHYRVQRGDTLAGVAQRYGVTAETLARLNHVRTSARLHAGRTITVPETAPVTVAAAAVPAPAAPAPAPPAATAATPPVALALPSPGGAVPQDVAQRESAEDAAAAAASKARTAATSPQPVSAAQAEALSPAIGPAAEAEQNADPNDYSVAHDDTIRVAGDETLGHYADWLSVSTQHVREINRFKFHRAVLIGQRIKLDFRKVSREAFEAHRREYHQQLQAAYFAAHRIVGTEVYIARPGDSVWTLTQRTAQMPMWLVQQYNPDVDLADLRAGTQIVMPRVQEVGSGG